MENHKPNMKIVIEVWRTKKLWSINVHDLISVPFCHISCFHKYKKIIQMLMSTAKLFLGTAQNHTELCTITCVSAHQTWSLLKSRYTTPVYCCSKCSAVCWDSMNKSTQATQVLSKKTFSKGSYSLCSS